MAGVVGTVAVFGLPQLMAGLSGLDARLRIANEKAMAKAVLLVEAGAKARVPRKTGRLFSSINGDVSGLGIGLTGRVGTDVTYGPYVEQGTMAHDISPLTAMALMVPIAATGGFGGGRLSGSPRVGQQVAFFGRVRHPGSRAHAYLGPALEDNNGKIQALFVAAANAVLREIAASTRTTLGLLGGLGSVTKK